MKLLPGRRSTTDRDGTRRRPTPARCGPSKTGLLLRPSKPIRDSAMGYGFQGQGQSAHIEAAPLRPAAIHKCVDDAAGVPQNKGR